MHAESPDLAEEVAEESGIAESDDSGVSPIERRYSIKGINSSEPRLCGPGMSTAALVTRFGAGLPKPLNELPRTKIVVLVRNPVDIVVARLQAKWVRGGPAWPACTLRTIGRCANELCGSMRQMLRTLPMAGDRLRLLRWETFARRKQRVAADLLSWLGATTNHTAVAELMVEVDVELRAFKALSDKYPISPRSTYLVEQQCTDVMQALGYKPTVASMADASRMGPGATSTAASGGGGAAGSSRRFVERGSRRHRREGRHRAAANASESAVVDLKQRPPALLLRHANAPDFALCPVRLAGAEPIMRFFVRRDRPEATTAPLCFPDNPSDRCPSRHGAKWHRSRWGAYPFEVATAGADGRVSLAESDAEGSAHSSAPPFTYAFVRNPFDRLVSAYVRHIATTDKGTSIHRAWIRELHGLGDRDPISFSHFVRWIAQQPVSVMHRAWQPFSEICQFDHVKYDYVGRLEDLARDFGHVMQVLKIGDADQRLWEQVSSKTRPAQSIGGHDRILRLQHYYHSDDEHDLVRIVTQLYRDDLLRFGYSFPGMNGTVLKAAW